MRQIIKEEWTSLSACAKLIEIIVHNALIGPLKNYIAIAQHGFMPNRSTSTNLIEFVSKCTSNINKDIQIDCIYLKTAFDSVSNDSILIDTDSKTRQARLSITLIFMASIISDQ